MSLSIQTKHAARKWFLLSGVLITLFLISSAIYATGMLDVPTLRVEQWLLLRPQSQIDCLLYEWRNLCEVPATLAIICVLGGVSIFSKRHRRRVLPYLVLLFGLGVGIEVVGKAVISLPLPDTLRSGMTNLTCPQINKLSKMSRFEVALGMLDKVPPPQHEQISWARDVSVMPLDLKAGEGDHSYPSGHALRWMFVCLVAAWLVWRHIRPLPIRLIVTFFLVAISIIGGFIQFYIGVHMLSDAIAGYLVGGAMACCAIGLLLLNDTQKRSDSGIEDYRYRNHSTPQNTSQIHA
jgi:membrane-associated phospholipid phosphatase